MFLVDPYMLFVIFCQWHWGGVRMLKIYIQITLEKYLQTRETYNWNNSLRHEPVGPDEFFSYPAIMPRRYFLHMRFSP